MSAQPIAQAPDSEPSGQRLLFGQVRALFQVAEGHLREAEAQAAGDEPDVEVALQLAWAEHYNHAAIAAAIQGLTRSLVDCLGQ